jgi:hypothetical protein
VGANDKPVTLRYSKIRGLEAAAKPGMGARE